MSSVNQSRLVQGLRGNNMQPVAQALSEQSAGVVDGLGGSVSREIGQDLKTLKLAINREMGRQAAASTDSATAYMLAGAMLGGTMSGVFVDVMQHNLRQIVSDPDQLRDFAGQVARAQGESPPQLDTLNGRVIEGLVKEQGVKPGNVPTALFISGVLLENEQRRGLLPGQ